MSTIYNLVNRAVDYAGLFPPAALPMSQVIDNYAKYLVCNESSMLGRLIIPASKLVDFEKVAKEHLANSPESPWRISALVPAIQSSQDSVDASEFEKGFQAIDEFNLRNRTSDGVRTLVDAVEIRTPNEEIVQATVQRLLKREDDSIKAFLEIPHASDPTPLVKLIAQQAIAHPVFAKVRTGGVTPELIPPANDVARFIHACVANEVGFKATAGLHHPIRSKHPLTYATDAPCGTMHGFLNVFVAAAIAFEHRTTTETLEEILLVKSNNEFEFTDERLTWNNYSVSNNSIIDTRNHGLISFGSCSFVEPTEELTQLPGMAHETIFS
ncbi:MAG: hypothetical protein P8J27_14565, partial [Mariniblastus sp.]|nr:hypothetical protein [Mariniblastus sp.]